MKKIFLFLIRFYQKTRFARIPILGEGTCRFQPTCSQYTYEVIEEYGILKGCFLGLGRILRCHPFSKGGEDPIPDHFKFRSAIRQLAERTNFKFWHGKSKFF